ncbi:hypothetical protein LTR36_003927 [Oleoguttula mirabilis]|uniref:RBR-type E3 ubiquitin transferase n=1 Tax=Oleoguttula mirabilis TaxID=1507867 RepID=A0AAV9JJI6_9PEZI|nr:hypothetical protein LTR36_003927 [Oleoguttula mirabilis]
MAPRKPVASTAAAPPAAATRRSARLQGVAAGPTPDAKARITKPKPAPEPKPQRYDCTTCDRKLAASSFPDHLATDSCKHLINTCKACTKTYIAVQLENTTYDKLACPECAEVMGNADVKRLASKEVYVRYDELERRGIAEKVPGWRWCLSPKCRAGQVHQPLVDDINARESQLNKAGGKTTEGGKGGKKGAGKKGVKKEEAEEASGKTAKSSRKKSSVFSDDICICETCGSKACVTCDRPYHEGETCAQYTERQNVEAEQATLDTIASKCKECPKCRKNIEKNGGCDAVYCTQCGEQFCWRCVTPYSVINTQGHGKGCTYAAPGRADPHADQQAPGNAAFGAMFN